MNAAEAEAVVKEALRRGLIGGTKQRDYSPHTPTPRQGEFLAREELESLYGGAAGGGKSDALLMAALKCVDQPNYAAIIFRRTYTDLSLPGAVMDRAREWLQNTDAKWNDKEKRWTFPSGASLTFGYLESENDKFRYQSAEFQFIGWDELTQFTETQYTYLLSRLRRLAGSKIPIRCRAASNPGGIGHEWVKARFVTGDGSRPFVPAKLDDNPHTDQVEYRKALAQLDTTTRAQLEQGLWIRSLGGLVYPFTEHNVVDALPNRPDWEYVLSVDFGASQINPSTSIGVTAYSFSLPDEVYKVRTELSAGMTPSKIAGRIKELEGSYDFTSYIGDQGALGIGYINEFRERWAIPMEPARKKDKLGFRRLMRGDIERGAYKVVKIGNEALIEEALTVTWNETGEDNAKGQAVHCTDESLYAWREAKHYLAEGPVKPLPPVGTPERAQAEEAAIIEAEETYYQKQWNKRWWEQ